MGTGFAEKNLLEVTLVNSRDLHFLKRSLTDFPLVIWRWNLRDDTFMTSAGIANFLYEQSSFRLRNMDEWIENAHPDDRPQLEAATRDLRNGKTERFSLLYRRRDEEGDWRWVFSQGEVSVRDAKGLPLEATGITVDQTRYKEMEQVALENRDNVISFFDTLDDLLFVCDEKGCVVESNNPQLALDLFEMTDLRGQDLRALFKAIGAPSSTLDAVFAATAPMNAFAVRDRKGKNRFLEIKTRHKTWSGKPALLGICHDSTVRESAQRELWLRRQQLELTLEAAEIGVWDWDLVQDEVTICENWVRMLGYTSDDIPSSAKVLFALMHPDDKDRARAILHSHLRGETPAYEVEFRALTNDGEWKWILSRGRVISRNAKGEPLRIVGTHTDISNRVRNQERIQELEALLREASTRDSLTGVLNRQEFRRILNREADRSRRYSSPLSLILINFDRFNLINSEYGHQAGDRLLVEASRLIGTEIRSSDHLARWSGEEFIILTPEKLRGALHLAEKLRAHILSTSFTGLPPISASFGVATYRTGEKLENLLQRVDIALYKAKKHQGNRVAFQE